MTRYRLIPVLALSFAMASPVASAAGRAAITPAQIADAINGAGMKISAEQVTLLTDVVAATGSPTLTVESMEPWGDHRMKVRLDCATPEECLPFFVAVSLSNETTATPAQAALNQFLAGKQGPKSVVVRAGSPATLLLDGGHVHIRLSVVCLENGAMGQKIRVASKDPRQTYTAQVIDSAVLRGNL
jgi:hypothetical protein